MQQDVCYSSATTPTALYYFDTQHFALITQEHTIEIVSIATCLAKNNFSINILDPNTTAIAFALHKPLMALAKGEQIYIIDTDSHKVIHHIQTQEGSIEKLSFVHGGPYLVSGTAHGRVMFYRYDGSTHIARLCSFPYRSHHQEDISKRNYVSAIAHKNHLLICSGYGGAVILINLLSHKKEAVFEDFYTKTTLLYFINDQEFIAVNSDGLLIVYDYITYEKKKILNTSQRDIFAASTLESKHYILLFSRSNTIILFDTQNYKILQHHFLSFQKNILAGEIFDAKTLILLFEDATLQKIELPTQADLQRSIAKGDLYQSLALLQNNKMLQESLAAKQLEGHYKKFLASLLNRAIQHNNQRYLQPAKAFETLSSRRNDYKNLLLAYKNYPRLLQLLQERKYALFYALCKTYPFLELTPAFLKVEAIYKDHYKQAQKYLLLHKKREALELLEPFLTVPQKRPMIDLLLRYNSEFLRFIHAIATRDYTTILQLLDVYPHFAEIPNYIELKTELTKLLESIDRAINLSDLDHAFELITEAHDNPLIQKEIQHYYSKALRAGRLIHYYEQNNFVKCYETIDRHPQLLSMQLAKLLQRHWSKLMKECEKDALNGNLASLRKRLGSLLWIHTRREKIGDLLRLSFQTKITQALQESNCSTAENLIYSYEDIFGSDSEIKKIMQDYKNKCSKNLAITLNSDEPYNRDKWVASEIFRHS